MQYRSFGKTNFSPSALGFGTMRLPLKGEDPADIDEAKTKEMIEYAIENDINYFDTAYVYHKGQSEVVLGKILKGNLRDKIKLATKLPSWTIETKSDFDKVFDEQLRRLQTDHIDFYLLHALNKENWKKIYNLGVLEWAEKKIAEGKILNLGFSFHDELLIFKEIINAYDKWVFCQIQYNILDQNIQAGMEGLKYASCKGLGVVIMSPLKGGKLSQAPKEIENIWNKSKIKRTPTEWALNWLWNQPEVSLVLSGMSTLEQVEKNIESAKKSGINSLTAKELDLIGKVKQKYQKLATIPCTKCGYCMPCPRGVNIPWIFELYNESFMFDNLASAKKQYSRFKPEEKTENCTLCKKCESLCPQKIKISEKLKEAQHILNQ